MEFFSPDIQQVNKRLDSVLASHSKVVSRSQAKKLIEMGLVQINKSILNVTCKRLIKQDDLISFSEQTIFQESKVEAVPHELNILYEDDFLLVLNKARGIVVHPAKGHSNDTLVNYLLNHTKLSDRSWQRPGIVHRLDKDTSGLLVIAKDNQSHDDLASQFSSRTIKRSYHTLAWGIPDRQSGIINKNLGRHPVDRKKFAVKNNGKEAITHWKILEKLKVISLIECRLMTGRTHQIRVHLSSIGHSIIGDTVYGSMKHFINKLEKDTIDKLKSIKGQALHAKTLGFIHPVKKEWMEFDSDLPEDMQIILVQLRRETII